MPTAANPSDCSPSPPGSPIYYIFWGGVFCNCAEIFLSQCEIFMKPYCNEGRRAGLRILSAHHHHMLPSCNPVVGLTFFTSAAACAARGLGAVAQGNVTFADRPRKTAAAQPTTRGRRRSVASPIRCLKRTQSLVLMFKCLWAVFFFFFSLAVAKGRRKSRSRIRFPRFCPRRPLCPQKQNHQIRLKSQPPPAGRCFHARSLRQKKSSVEQNCFSY